jgi:hypothetical protein
MGASMIYTFAPNRKVQNDTTNSTTWHQFTGFPGLDAGMFCQNVEVYSQNNGAGSLFYVAWNTASTPTDTISNLVPAGTVFVIPGDVHNIWIRKTVAADNIVCTALY